MKPLLLRAAELLEREAAILADSYRQQDGAWASGRAGAEEYDELMATAAELRREQQAADKAASDMCWALNSGDGVYRP